MNNQLPDSVRIIIISVSLIFGFFLGLLWYFSLIPAAILFYVAQRANARNQHSPSGWLEFVSLAGMISAMGILVCCHAGTIKWLEHSGHQNIARSIDIALIVAFVISTKPWNRWRKRDKVPELRLEGQISDLENEPRHG
ncbi:hypothetical protein [Gimesia aquarii]|uniref:Uncharacterized protein n=1 Tax=Gimesia aquarii TaxID=2527964 RepID=A0A517WN28_9PLAN|nr:hypothetical protein [Gimesia aquarii]QDU06672.1 hypothetical protein V202x_00150 [Gimesia aquarii]